jgi:hypothetical protein
MRCLAPKESERSKESKESTRSFGGVEEPNGSIGRVERVHTKYQRSRKADRKHRKSRKRALEVRRVNRSGELLFRTSSGHVRRYMVCAPVHMSLDASRLLHAYVGGWLCCASSISSPRYHCRYLPCTTFGGTYLRMLFDCWNISKEIDDTFGTMDLNVVHTTSIELKQQRGARRHCPRSTCASFARLQHSGNTRKHALT